MGLKTKNYKRNCTFHLCDETEIMSKTKNLKY